MRIIVSLLIILTVFGCSKTEDNTDDICITECTILQGRFISMDNKGVPGVKISVEYRIGGGLLPSHVRKIAETITDENGNFYKEFYINEDELGHDAGGYFDVPIDITNINNEKYILSNHLSYGVPTINTRDTVIGNSFYLPKKTHITVNLVNFNPLQENDYFEVRSLYPFGSYIGYNEFLDSPYQTGSSGYDTFKALGQNTKLNVFVAENERNVIRIARRKNGINSIKDFPLYVPSNNSIELTYEY